MRLGLGVLVFVVACSDPLAPQAHVDESEPAAGSLAPERTSPAPIEADCLTRLREGTPPELRAALGDLGWQSVFEDACAADGARASGNASACDGLALNALRAPCRDRVAIVTGTPSECSLGSEAHDALCIALASRRASLCRAVPLGRRAACEAMLGRRGREPDPERCGRPDVPDEATCRQLVESLGALVPEERVEPGRTELAAELHTVRSIPLGSGRDRGEPEEEDLSERELGAVLTWDGCTRVLRLGTREGDPMSRRARYFVEVRLTGPSPWRVPTGEGARVVVSRPSFGEAAAGPIDGGDAEVRVAVLEPEIGGRLDLSVRGALARMPGEVEVELTVRTIVRDVIGVAGEGCE